MILQVSCKYLLKLEVSHVKAIHEKPEQWGSTSHVYSFVIKKNFELASNEQIFQTPHLLHILV